MANFLKDLETITPIAWPDVAFFDLDGTLINASGSISNEGQASVRQLQSHGVKTCIATGRPYFATHSIIETLGINQPSMFFSGALIVDTVSKKPLYLEFIDPNILTEIIKLARKLELYTELYTTDSYFVDRKSSILTPIHSEYLLKDPQERNLLEVANTEKIVKVGIMVKRGTEMDFDKQFHSAFPEVPNAIAYGAAHPEIAFLNFTSPKASRQHAFDFFMKHFNTSADKTMAFGDGHSDIPFLQLAGCGVAMGNADQQVHEAANYVTLSVEENGVSYSLNRLLQSEP